MISGIILAAGEAKRMGQQKLYLNFRDKPVLQWALEAALSSELDEVVCVVRELKEIQQGISLKHDKLRWICNKKADEGQSTSIIVGLKSISPQSEAALFLVGDQPLVNPELINSLIELFKKTDSLIVAPTFQGQTRNPVLFHSNLFPEILELRGDRGARGLIEKYREKAVFLEWKDQTSFLDLDTWEDYEVLNRKK
jgi:molybdenum cofactor cytidylyltransferase